MVAEEVAVTGPAAKVIHADATKDFFVTMITRDISLRDCIFDLLDNAIDGARRSLSSNERRPFDGYIINIDFDKGSFVIRDNCGGIRLSDAIDYAFHFGRRPDSPADVKGGIGLYGIGMKRAIFKIGKKSDVTSHADDASFKVVIDVAAWEKSSQWDFEYEDVDRSRDLGTEISISRINDGVAQQLGDAVFRNELSRSIARDYAFFINQGLVIKVCGGPIPSYKYQLRQSASMSPSVEYYEDDGVKVRILAGLVDDLPDDIPDDLRPDKVDRFGWFVICNGRVVLAADKGDETIWGVDGFNVWHPQYNGFAGFVFFDAQDQRKLPWTTTKRDLDASSPLYRRTISRMKSVTLPFIKYTNKRKADIPAAKIAEAPVNHLEVYELSKPQALKLPTIADVSRPVMSTISYQRERAEIEAVKVHLGSIGMTMREVGIRTFEYYLKAEMGK